MNSAIDLRLLCQMENDVVSRRLSAFVDAVQQLGIPAMQDPGSVAS